MPDTGAPHAQELLLQSAANAQPEAGPSPEDVLFGRACLAFNLVTREQINLCVADQRRLAGQGRTVTIPQVMIGRQLINAQQYQHVVERVRQYMAGQQGGAAGAPVVPPTTQQFRVAAVLPPEITATGKYRTEPVPGAPPRPVPPPAPSQPILWQQAPAPKPDEIAEAARTWDDAASTVGSTDYEVVVEPVPPAVVVTPQAVRERKDAGIRNVLGIPEDQDEFDFGPYRILGDVASGGMGIIYRARASDTGQVYALKALLNVENANEKQLRRFIQEAQSAMRLEHPGIVRIFDIGILENIPYFTMDLIQGKDFHDTLKAKSMDMPAMLGVLAKVCDAVHYAHEHGVIHRDLKPANVIIRSADMTPILTDFGLAKNLDSTFKLTAEGAMVGTPLFLSPEQVSGKAMEVDRRCDVYGLGVMLYQILTERLPFVGRNPYEVYKKVLEEDPTPPSQIKPATSPDIEKVCLMALAKDREERFPTAAAMAEDIRRHLAGQPVVAKLPTPAAVAKAKLAGGSPEASAARKAGAKDTRGPAPVARPGDPAGTMILVGIGVAVLLIILGMAYIVYALVAP